MPPLKSALTGVSFLAMLGLNANIQASTPAADSTADAQQIQLGKDIQEVETSVGMSAPMESETVDGVDPVQEAADLGWIIDVSLDEVESALDSAAATATADDDIEAMRLKHQGSYRFYSGEVYSSEISDSPSDTSGTSSASEN